MIIWIDGTFGSGKTTIAEKLINRFPNSILLDFDEVITNIKPVSFVPMELFTGKGYPQSKRYYVEAMATEIDKTLEKSGNNLVFVSMALISDFCKELLITHFNNITNTVHFILCVSENKMCLRIDQQVGRDKNLAKTYYAEATSYLNENYLDAIRIDTDNKTIDEICIYIEKCIADRR